MATLCFGAGQANCMLCASRDADVIVMKVGTAKTATVSATACSRANLQRSVVANG